MKYGANYYLFIFRLIVYFLSDINYNYAALYVGIGWVYVVWRREDVNKTQSNTYYPQRFTFKIRPQQIIIFILWWF